MGQTVVFTVALDNDEVVIGRSESRPPNHPYRDALRELLHDRRWHRALGATLVVPAAVALATFAITRGPWVGTAYLVAAAIVVPASAAYAARAAPRAAWERRVAHLFVTGLSGAALVVVLVPGVAFAFGTEDVRWQGAGPTLGVLALAGATGAWLGLVLTEWRAGAGGLVAAGVTAALALAPLAAFAALLPTTISTDTVTVHTFDTSYAGNRPAYVCVPVDEKATRRHTELIAWIAFGSPVAWAIDAAQIAPSNLADAGAGSIAQSQAWTRSTRLGPDDFEGYCFQPTSLGPPPALAEQRYEAVAPLGAQVAWLAGIAALAAAAPLTISRRRSE